MKKKEWEEEKKCPILFLRYIDLKKTPIALNAVNLSRSVWFGELRLD